MDGCWMVVRWMDGWLEKAELKPTQPSLAGAWLSLAIFLPFRSAFEPKNLIVKDLKEKTGSWWQNYID